MKQPHRARKVVRVLIVAGVLSLASRSEAILLNLTPDPSREDFTSNFIGVSYDAGTDLFQAIGYTSGYTNGSATLIDYYDNTTWTLTATITDVGNLTSGSLTVEGDITDDSTANTQVLLTGTLNTGAEGTAFGSSNAGGGQFEFLFQVSGGVLANDFGGIGALGGGVILFPFFESGVFDGTWTSNFSNDGFSGVADTVPEPSSLILLVLAGTLCVATHRNRKRARVTVA